MGGDTAHWLLKVGDEDTETWKATEQDLRSIAPPLTRILNRYDATRAAAAAGDEALLVAAVGRYGIRNYTRRRRLLAAQAEQGPRPITGVEAPAGTGPEHDPGWQQAHGDPFAGEPAEDDAFLQAPPDITPKGAHRR